MGYHRLWVTRGAFKGEKVSRWTQISMGYGGLWAATGMGYDRSDCSRKMLVQMVTSFLLLQNVLFVPLETLRAHLS